MTKEEMREWARLVSLNEMYEKERDEARARVDTLEAREIDYIVQIEEARKLAEELIEVINLYVGSNTTLADLYAHANRKIPWTSKK